jgi:hypothetical protein
MSTVWGIKQMRLSLPIAVLIIIFLCGPNSSDVAAAPGKERLIVLADMGHDPDEEQQIVHLLVCSNEVDLEGLIAATGRFFRANPVDSTKWLMPHLFHHLIDGYAEVYPNLQLHASNWPTPEYLRSIVANGQTGNGMLDVGKGRWSSGSRLIANAIRRQDDRPLHIVINTGANTLAQALFELRESTAPEELEELISRVRVLDNGGQDESGAWICHEFPTLHYVRSVRQNRGYGGPTNSNLGPHCWKPYPYSPMGQDAWASEHIRNDHGALGAMYPSRTVSGVTHFIEGGGTIPWLGLVSRGLTDPSQPSWGGWSGRYSVQRQPNVFSAYPMVRADEQRFVPFDCFTDENGIVDRWTDKTDGKVHESVYACVWRWRAAMWSDFQARMDWCVQPTERANHHPHAVLNGDVTASVLRLVLMAWT